MISSSRGIVFHQLKYSETSIIAKIFTEKFGLQSYIIKGARRKKSKISPVVFQHLSLVELTANHKEKSNIHFLQDVRLTYQYSSIPYDIHKSSILLLINEILYRSIKEEEVNTELFDFISNSLQWLDLRASGFANFHLVFLLQLSKYLGFFPKGLYSDTYNIFNMNSGCFESVIPNHPNYFNEKAAYQFSLLVQVSFENMLDVPLNSTARNNLLNNIIEYYQLHVPNLGTPKSLKVLKEVLS
ncbi:MAG: DNA repair protein RecO [Bacteroidetes bacterium]|nr:DNA repair protein RecO [Bacteroidota bacterium]